jgi:hypothetical protein
LARASQDAKAAIPENVCRCFREALPIVIFTEAPIRDLAVAGAVRVVIEPGFHATKTVTFEAPKPDGKERRLYLVLESVKNEQSVYREDRVCFTINDKGE